MSRATSFTRTGLLAVLLAMVGFSYSLATSNSGGDGIGGDSTGDRDLRAGTFTKPGASIPLDFANPFCTDGSKDRDLGDVLSGSQFTRLARAKGGVPSYTFSSKDSQLAGSLNTIKLLANGIITGKATVANIPTAGSTAIRFDVTVTDSLGTGSQVTNKFRLSFFNTSAFRFAQSKLSDGILFKSYSDTLSLLNGTAPYTFTAANAKLNGTATTLDAVGLSLSSDGAVYGVPLKAGTLTFDCTAVDKNKNKAAGRSGTGTSQNVTLVIISSKVVSSVIVASSITIKTGSTADKKGVFKDSLQYKGNINSDGVKPAALSGQTLECRVGAYTAPVATFDAKGTASTAKGAKPSASGKYSTKGQFQYKVGSDSINVGTVSGSTVTLAVEFRIGNAIVSSEVLTFTVKAGKSGNTLTYKAGDKKGSKDADGSFLLTSVQGSDDKGGTGDAWKVGFIGRTNADQDLTGATTLTLSIGTGNVNDLSISAKGTKFSGKGAKGSGLSAFSLDTNSGKGSFTTGVLASTGTNSTGIPLASKAGSTSNNFACNLNFTGAKTGTQFEGALAIFPNKSKWSSTLPK